MISWYCFAEDSQEMFKALNAYTELKFCALYLLSCHFLVAFAVQGLHQPTAKSLHYSERTKIDVRTWTLEEFTLVTYLWGKVSNFFQATSQTRPTWSYTSLHSSSQSLGGNLPSVNSFLIACLVCLLNRFLWKKFTRIIRCISAFSHKIGY